MSKPLYVISCPFDTYSGYGARARDYVKAVIDTDKYEVKLMSQRWGETAWNFCEENKEWTFLNEYRLSDNKLTTKPDIWTQITIPNEFQAVGKYNIGVTAGIETTMCAADWIEGLNRMDLNLVSSQHSKTVFEQTAFEKKNKNTNQVESKIQLQKPVEVLFEGYNTDVYKRLDPKEVHLDLSDINESFCYLFVGHWMQGGFGHDRKNVAFMIKSFLETFKNKKQKPALILKTSVGTASYSSREEILKRINNIKKTVVGSNLPSVYLINGEMSDQEMNELYNHPKVKAMVSFTKGEGFGRPLLEFTATGKPIAASGWSGQVDFLSSQNSFLVGGTLENVDKSAANKWILTEGKWFKPDSAIVGSIYKEMYKNYKNFVVRGKKERRRCIENFSYEEMVKLLDNYLQKYVPEFPKQVELKLPELPKLEKIG
jgi:glycosyltransferase involved in cell wall biosynthesis